MNPQPQPGRLRPEQLPLHHQDPEARQEEEDQARDQDPAEPGGGPEHHSAAGRGELLGVVGFRVGLLHGVACYMALHGGACTQAAQSRMLRGSSGAVQSQQRVDIEGHPPS